MLKRSAAPLRAVVRTRVALPTRSFATAPQPHPLSRRPTPAGPAASRPGTPRPPQREQKWSNLTLILLATLTGSLTYALGRVEGSSKAASNSQKTLEYSAPTKERFDKAVEEIAAWFPAEEMDQSRETLVAHGYNEWGVSRPRSCTRRAAPATRTVFISFFAHAVLDICSCAWSDRSARSGTLPALN